MLAFHGTGGPRSLVEKIFDEGLVPAPHAWTHDTTGIDKHVFACTTPIGGKGGDPIHFAQRRLYGTRDTAWLLVLDVPASSVRGAVPNGELEQYWQVRSFSAVAFDRSAQDTSDLLSLKRERRCATRDLLEYRVASTAPDLTAGAPDAHTLVQFERAFIRARDRADKQRVAMSYKLTLPPDFLRDPHYPWCMGCMHKLFSVDIVAPGIPARSSRPPGNAPRSVTPATRIATDAPHGPSSDRKFSRGSFDRLDLTHFASLLDALDRWLAAHDDPSLSSFADLQRRYPPPRDEVPRAMWPDFVTHDLAARMREPDTQVLLDHVPPEHIVGAIDLGSRSRLSKVCVRAMARRF